MERAHYGEDGGKRREKMRKKKTEDDCRKNRG